MAVAINNNVQLDWSVPSLSGDSVLVFDPDQNNTSGPQIETTLHEFDYTVIYENSLPQNIDPYSAIFTCLGIYSLNHQLTAGEGQQLADYLNNGGNLYMEGGDTWYFDTQTAVHPMFNITGLSDGTDDLNIILGDENTITSGMAFNYVGENNWIDHIAPNSTAFLLLKNDNPEYGVAVADTVADLYNTIGTSFEFGGLEDNTMPSTKQNLMIKYLQIFGILGKSADNFDGENLLGYNLYRSDDIGLTYSKVNTQLITETEYIDNALEIGTYYYYAKAVYEDGISIPSNIDSVNVIVGINEKEILDLSVYPNPATDEIMIKSVVPILNISLFNAIGNKVYNKPANNISLKIPVSRLNQGIYYLKINIGNNIVIKKVIIQR